jgi:hypothetical protein
MAQTDLQNFLFLHWKLQIFFMDFQVDFLKALLIIIFLNNFKSSVKIWFTWALSKINEKYILVW